MSTTTNSTLNDILKAIVVTGITAASIFVKNPNSQQHAADIINLVQSILPVFDGLLNKPTTTVQS